MGFLRVLASRRFRLVFNVVSVVGAVAIGLFTARHFVNHGWPLGHAKILGVFVAGCLFLIAFGFKAWGWKLLFRRDDRPDTLALAAAGGAASVTGLALPGRCDEVVRVAVVRRFRGHGCGVGTCCLSLFLLGLVDNAALAPLASVAAGISAHSGLVRGLLILIGASGVGAGLVVGLLPRLSRVRRIVKYRFVGWVGHHAASPREASKSFLLVLVSWVLRVAAVFVLLDALTLHTSIPLALGFLVASASASALPIAPAGGVAQAGAGAAMLAAAGIGTPKAVAFAVAAQGLVVLAGAVVLVLTVSVQMAKRLRTAPVLVT
jgi:uncharacterized membrane protein YbhN (UPF0104 family)